MTEYDTLATSFKRALLAQNKANQTIISYMGALRLLTDYLDRNGSPVFSTLKRSHVESFFAELANAPNPRGGKYRPATLSNRYKALQAFFKWAVEEGEIKRSPMERMKPPTIPEEPARVLTDEQLRRLLKICEGKDFYSRRDNAILRLLIDTGMRRSECGGLKVSDIDWDRGGVTVMGKGSRPRLCPFGAKTAQALDRYLRARAKYPRHESPSLWLGANGPMGHDGIRYVVERRGKEAGIEHLYTHLFRHAFAHRYLKAGGQEQNLMRLTGWRASSMLQRYAASTADERAREEHHRLGLGDDL